LPAPVQSREFEVARLSPPTSLTSASKVPVMESIRNLPQGLGGNRSSWTMPHFLGPP
jgi:hypothetical protein